MIPGLATALGYAAVFFLGALSAFAMGRPYTPPRQPEPRGLNPADHRMIAAVQKADADWQAHVNFLNAMHLEELKSAKMDGILEERLRSNP